MKSRLSETNVLVVLDSRVLFSVAKAELHMEACPVILGHRSLIVHNLFK